MIMLADWHPDIIEFIISKMQNPRVLKWLSENSKDEQVRELAQRKLKFIPLSRLERQMLETLIESKNTPADVLDYAQQTLLEGGRLEVVNPEFLSGANISVTLTDEFMEAVEKNGTFDLRVPGHRQLYPAAERSLRYPLAQDRRRPRVGSTGLSDQDLPHDPRPRSVGSDLLLRDLLGGTGHLLHRQRQQNDQR